MKRRIENFIERGVSHQNGGLNLSHVKVILEFKYGIEEDIKGKDLRYVLEQVVNNNEQKEKKYIPNKDTQSEWLYEEYIYLVKTGKVKYPDLKDIHQKLRITSDYDDFVIEYKASEFNEVLEFFIYKLTRLGYVTSYSYEYLRDIREMMRRSLNDKHLFKYFYSYYVYMSLYTNEKIISYNNMRKDLEITKKIKEQPKIDVDDGYITRLKKSNNIEDVKMVLSRYIPKFLEIEELIYFATFENKPKILKFYYEIFGVNIFLIEDIMEELPYRNPDMEIVYIYFDLYDKILLEKGMEDDLEYGREKLKIFTNRILYSGIQQDNPEMIFVCLRRGGNKNLLYQHKKKIDNLDVKFAMKYLF